MNARSFDTSFPIRPSVRKTASGTKAEAPNAVSARTLAASGNTVSTATSARHPGNYRSHRLPIGATIAKLWGHWKDEREIRRAIRELSELDDHTLRDLGIRDRSEIEFTVRFSRPR